MVVDERTASLAHWRAGMKKQLPVLFLSFCKKLNAACLQADCLQFKILTLKRGLDRWVGFYWDLNLMSALFLSHRLCPFQEKMF
jgi:hypothetical protein